MQRDIKAVVDELTKEKSDFTLLWKLGNDKQNREVLEDKLEGHKALYRRPETLGLLGAFWAQSAQMS